MATTITKIVQCTECEGYPCSVWFKNGEGEMNYCEGCFARALLDLVLHNDYLILESRTLHFRGVRIVEVKNA